MPASVPWLRHVFALPAPFFIPLFMLLNVTYFGINLALVLPSEAPAPAHLNPVTFGLTILNLLLQALALLWRNSRPDAMLLYGTVLFVIGLLIMRQDMLHFTPSFFYLIFTYSSLRLERRQLLALGGALLCVLLATAANVPLHYPEVAPERHPAFIATAVSTMFFTFLILFGAGSWYGAIRRQDTLQRSNAELVESEQDARLQTALVMERNHMARELHDVAAHHLTTIMVQSKALRRQPDLNEEDAREMLEVIAVESTHAVRNMNAIVGILRQHNDTAELPQLSKLPVLLENLAKHDADVQLSIEGDLDTVGAQASLTCYRIVQESVTNARKHASGTAITVTITRTLRQIAVEIANSAPVTETGSFDASGGYGIIGMQERVQLLGGSLRSGPSDDGGWSISAVIPIESERTPA